ncbi:MAG: M48 family metallopeptidase [Burkholderiaceae bacterium]|jgi:predicted metal-dependent hydrolase|nr:M48 family metallopeptidase [Burkholderiaceae bacterium]
MRQGARPLQLSLFAADALPQPSPSETALSPATVPEETPSALKKRAIALGGITINYELRRSKRRSIGFLVNASGLRVTAPRWVTLTSVEDAIREKERWITRKLHHFLQLAASRQNAPWQAKDGAMLPYLGREFILRLIHGQSDHIVMDEANAALLMTHKDLNPAPGVIVEHLKKWLQEKAHHIFSKRLPLYAALLGVNCRAFTLSSAKQRWGSCSVSGNIRLNWRLVHFTPDVIDYVIVHELAHLREMNHSKLFWEIVSTAYPDYLAARKRLNRPDAHIPPL